MNRRLVVAVGVLCAVGITAGAASTALAGTSSARAASASHSTSAKSSSSLQVNPKPTITVGKATALATSQALNDRQEVGASEKISLKDQKSSHLSVAVNAISTVVTRDEQEAQAMQKAAQELNNLTATLKGATTSPAKPGSANAKLTLWSEFGHLPDSQVHIGGMKGSVRITAGPHHS